MLRRSIPLLTVDPDLGRDLAPEELREAEHALVVPAAVVTPGRLDWDAVLAAVAVRGRVLAALIVDGLVAGQLQLGERWSSQLLGPGDLVAPHDGSDLPVLARMELHVQQRTTLAVLDDRFLAACRRWPRLFDQLYRRATRLGHESELQRAILQLPRVEDRLLGTFWCLAERWGSVDPRGIVIDLAISHEALGHYVGARRPTVSLGLKALAEDGVLVREASDRWRLAPASMARLTAAGAPIPRPAAASVRARRSVTPRERAELVRRLQRLREAKEAGRERAAARAAS